MADKNIVMKEKTASGYDNLYPKPSKHGSTHTSGNDPLPSNAVGTTQIASDAVTPAKCNFFDASNRFAPAGAIKLTSGVHYFNSVNDIPASLKVTGVLVFVKAS